jgi:hypothetical protein
MKQKKLPVSKKITKKVVKNTVDVTVKKTTKSKNKLENKKIIMPISRPSKVVENKESI